MGGNLSFPTVDLTGKVALVTGGNAGIGYETSKVLAMMGAHTIIACRSDEKAAAAIEQMKAEIAAESPDKASTVTLESMKLDLSSFKSTKDFVVAFREKGLPLHILINNAGLISPFALTENGFETTFQVNHLSHFLLTLELLPVILDTAKSSGDCRIVIVSSSVHKNGVFDPNNMNGEVSFARLQFYGNSKLYNVMHAYALQRRLKQVGVTVSVLHPGFVHTRLGNKGSADSTAGSVVWNVFQFVTRPFQKDLVKGAATSINCAVNPELNKQECHYYSDCAVAPAIPRALDERLQEQLWEMSINNVKDWLSPEILEKYGPVTEQGLEEATPTQEEHVAPPTQELGTSNNQPPTQEESSNNQPPPQEEPSNNQPPPQEEPSNNQPPPQEEPSNNQPPTQEVEPSNDQPPTQEKEPSNDQPTADATPTEPISTEGDPSIPETSDDN